MGKLHIRATRTEDGAHHTTVEPAGEWPLDIEIEEGQLKSLQAACERRGAGAGLLPELREVIADLPEDARKALLKTIQNRG